LEAVGSVIDSAVELALFALITVTAVAAGAVCLVMALAGQWTAAAVCGGALVVDLGAGALMLL